MIDPPGQDKVAELIGRLADNDTMVRRTAVLGLEAIGKPAVPALSEALRDENWHKRRLAAESLGKIGPAAADAVPALAMIFNDENAQVRQSAAEALGRIGRDNPAAVDALRIALDDGVVNVRRSAAQALVRVGPLAIPMMVNALDDKDTDVRQLAAEGLGRMGSIGQAGLPGLVRLLGDIYADVRRAAGESLERIGPLAIPALEAAIHKKEVADESAAVLVLERIRRAHGVARAVVQGDYPARGDVLDETFAIVKLIGQGAEAQVFKAKAIKPVPLLGLDEEDLVIVKYYHPGHTANPEGQEELARWFRGYKLTRDRPIDGLRRVLDCKEFWVAVLQWVPGKSVSEYIAERSGPPPGQAELNELVTSFLRILDAMIQINRRGLVFRDLKPQNIIVTTSSDDHQTWTLIDTGLVTEISYDGSSSLTTRATILGTPLYAAPELLDEAALHPKDVEAVDVYSVGATLYKVVTGEDMFSGGLTRILRQKLFSTSHDSYLLPERINPNVDSRLSQILQGCLRFAPDDRYRSLQLIYNDLIAWLQRGKSSRQAASSAAYDAFIAYASPDRRDAANLYNLLAGYKVFLDSHRLEPGGRWPDEIRDAQRNSRVTVALLSKYTAAAHYEVEEIQRALALWRKEPDQHRIIPVYLEPLDPPYGLQVLQSLTVSEGNLAAIAQQLRPLLEKRSEDQ